MLIFPVCIIYFLRMFGENKFSIPVYHQNAAELSSEYCQFSEGQHHIPDFALVNQKSQPLSAAYFDDHITVVNFFYTNCPATCREVNSELLRVQGNFFHDQNVRILSVTLDPEVDQPDVLAQYSVMAGAHEMQWNFATGGKDRIFELLRCGFVLPATGEGNLTVEDMHSDRLVLVDSQRRIRGYYSGTDREDVDRLVTEMKILLQEEKFEL